MSLGLDDMSNFSLLNHAVDHGINYFDTADMYQKGQNEITLGRALKKNREKVILATKVGNQWRPDGSGWDWNPTKDYILTSVEGSLRRLQTDYIDLYQLHGGTINDPIDETIEAFERLKDQGKIRYYGISSIRPNVIREYVRRSNIISAMMQYSLLDRRPEETCLSILMENKIGVLARGSLAKGLLAQKTAIPYLNYNETEVREASDTIAQVAENGRTNAEVAIRFVLNPASVTSAVVGIRTLEQLNDCLAIADTTPLTGAEIEKLRSAIPVNKYEEHC